MRKAMSKRTWGVDFLFAKAFLKGDLKKTKVLQVMHTAICHLPFIYHQDIPNESHSRLTTDSFCSFSEGVWQTNVFPVNQHRILDFITFALNFPDKTNWKCCLWDLTWLLCMDDGLGYELTLQMLCKQLQSLGIFYQFWESCLGRKNVCLSVCSSSLKKHTSTYCTLNTAYCSSWLRKSLAK